MAKVIIYSAGEKTDEIEHAKYLVHLVSIGPSFEQSHYLSGLGYSDVFDQADMDTLVYLPLLSRDGVQVPDLDEAKGFIDHWKPGAYRQLIIVSSAAIYGSRPHNPGLMDESQSLTPGQSNRLARAWKDFEGICTRGMEEYPDSIVTILRPSHVLIPGKRDYLGGLLTKRWAFTLAGHDPSLQWLHPEDLAGAVVGVAEHQCGGVFNISPAGVTTLRASLRLAGTYRIPTPRWPQRILRWIGPQTHVSPIDHLEYIRYNWTVSSGKLTEETGFIPKKSSFDAIVHFLNGPSEESPLKKRLALRKQAFPATFDDFGLDKKYLAAYSRTLLKFMEDFYWRFECRGLEHIPVDSRAMLAGVHRGFMPLDGVMTMHLIAKETGRHPRFLIHPTLLKFPFQFNFMTKIGGIIACQQNADHVLEKDGLVGFYPEGIQGAFRYYKGVYELGKFGRNEFVRMALRNRAPIVPFVTVGNAEIFPIFGKIKWQWWMRFSLWPVFPFAPPFPFLPVPLPSKWHIRFLEPIHIEKEYPPEAANDHKIVRAISDEVRSRMQVAINEMLAERKHIFWGSVFKD